MRGLSSEIRFTDEQAMLLESATVFCREKSSISAVRAKLASEFGFERALWNEMVGLGWIGIAVPEPFGGSGLGLAAVATITEPMGRRLMATPFVSTQLFIQGLLAGGTEAQKSAILPKLCGGQIGTVALFERDGDWSLEQLDCTALISGGNATLSGVKTLVCDAAVADYFLVSVAVSGAPALLLLDAKALPANCRRRETVIDETRRSYQLDLNGLTVPGDSLIAGAAARSALRAIRNCGLLLASAEASGGIAGALDVIVEYLNLRTTFGRKIGSYQSLKHTAADILVNLERSRSHLYHAATLLGDSENSLRENAELASAEVALRMAKVEAGDGLVFAGDRAVQFHGGFGFTYECDAQLYLRRGLWLQYTFGDAAHHRRRLADLLLPI